MKRSALTPSSGAAAAASGGGLRALLVGTHVITALMGYGWAQFGAAHVPAPRCPPCAGGAGDDVVPEPAWMVQGRAAAELQLARVAEGGERTSGTLIPSRDAVVAYGVEGAEPAPVVVFPDSVPQVVRALYRGVNGLVNPYSGFDAAGWPLDLQGWNGEESTLPQMVWETNASVVIEVGSWKGMSAAALGAALKEVHAAGRLPAGVAPMLLCVDTWQGAPEFLENRLHGVDPDRDMYTLHGWPLVYFQFLANMVHSGLTGTVFPLPAGSLIAAEYVRRADPEFRADVIYVDGRCARAWRGGGGGGGNRGAPQNKPPPAI